MCDWPGASWAPVRWATCVSPSASFPGAGSSARASAAEVCTLDLRCPEPPLAAKVWAKLNVSYLPSVCCRIHTFSCCFLGANQRKQTNQGQVQQATSRTASGRFAAPREPHESAQPRVPAEDNRSTNAPNRRLRDPAEPPARPARAGQAKPSRQPLTTTSRSSSRAPPRSETRPTSGARPREPGRRPPPRSEGLAGRHTSHSRPGQGEAFKPGGNTSPKESGAR